MNKLKFNAKVLANNMNWRSLDDKLAAVAAFYAPVCEITFEVIKTSLQPVFNGTYPGLAPIYVVERGWYDTNIARPHTGDADIVIFITPQNDHIGMTTYKGLMASNNVGPWEITIFADGEYDHVYMQEKDLGNDFIVILEHELSHAFYFYCGKRDDTHVHFPVNQNPYTDKPENVLVDFDFSQRYPALEYLKEKLMQALVLLRIVGKKNLASNT